MHTSNVFGDICAIMDLGGDLAVGDIGASPGRRTSDPTKIDGGKASTTFIPTARQPTVPETKITVAPTAEAEQIEEKVKQYLAQGYFLIDPKMTEFDYDMQKAKLNAAYDALVTLVHPGAGTRSGKFLSVLGKPKQPAPADTTPQQPTEVPMSPEMIPPLPPGATVFTPATAFSPTVIFNQIRAKWNSLTQTQKIMVVGGSLAAIGLVAFLIVRSRQPPPQQGGGTQ